MITTVLFYVFAALLIASAIGVITARNPVHSALFLVFAFVQSAVLWMLLNAEFLALILVLVYVGAVMVLFLFVVMMLDVNVEELRSGFTRYLPLGIAVAAVVAVEIGNVVWYKSQGLPFLKVPNQMPAGYSNTEALGTAIYTQHIFAFETAAVLLLLAIVAAITLTMRHRPGARLQNISRQVAVRAEDRVRLVRMKTVTEPTEDPTVGADEPAGAVEGERSIDEQG